ncbi:hypothetical protein EV702DRAFT_1048851 [Suillus placidus]|uniref:Uncharacterized protein n=1 Tax=Suillus placidus TaxID=48579 RepID=A0A9P6ZM11_9AGAM|nr:hypothetical protein EV702DRAFT_1048851 [Suillus placidus]
MSCSQMPCFVLQPCSAQDYRILTGWISLCMSCSQMVHDVVFCFPNIDRATASYVLLSGAAFPTDSATTMFCSQRLCNIVLSPETQTGASVTIPALIRLWRRCQQNDIRTSIGIGKGTHSSIIAQRKTKMPAAQWTTKEQYEWLQAQLAEYTVLHGEDKDYTHFWPKTHLYWFKRWPERAALFPDIPIEIPLTEEQQAAETAVEKSRKVQLQTWFRWRTNASKKNCGLKKETSIFETALLPKSRAKSVEEIYMDMVYDERIKPLVAAEQEAGNVATAGRRMALGRKFCKELLEDESDEVKKEVREKYNKQKKVKKDVLDDEADNDEETDADAIAKGIDDLTNHLPALCTPHQEEDSIYSLLHMRWTGPEAELGYRYFILKQAQCAAANIGDDNETKELEGNGEEPEDAEENADAEDGEENDEGRYGDSIDWDNLGFYIVSRPPDAN